MATRRKLGAAAPAATNFADTLDAVAVGDLLHGLGGRDLLRSGFDRTSLFGDGGNDRLVTTLKLAQPSSIAWQYGGEGNDTLTARIELNAESAAKAEIFQYGDAGNDRITAVNLAIGLDRVEAINTVQGGTGDDVVNLKAMIGGAPMVSYATNNVSGGAGNDRITALAQGDFGGITSYATNRIFGGAGDDVIDVVASVNSNSGYHALNEVQGGLGDDAIRATANAGSNDSISTAENVVDGGAGDDDIEIFANAGGNWHSIARSVAIGGDGADSIYSAQRLSAMSLISATVRLDGGNGADRLESIVAAEWADNLTKVSNRLDGGAGADELIARLEMSGTGAVAASNRLDGDAGNDRLTAEIVGPGRSLLYGGSGADVLKVSGGQNNLLNGEGGADRLYAGDGDDRLIGGGGADSFVFFVGANQGTDTLLDFDGSLDRLCFSGINDLGAPGLADDLDAMTTVVDQGAGLDVIVTFTRGTVLRFEGCGLGTDFIGQPLIDSLADLVDNARTQLLIEPL